MGYSPPTPKPYHVWATCDIDMYAVTASEVRTAAFPREMPSMWPFGREKQDKFQAQPNTQQSAP